MPLEWRTVGGILTTHNSFPSKERAAKHEARVWCEVLKSMRLRAIRVELFAVKCENVFEARKRERQ